jgi:hypothetical protein
MDKVEAFRLVLAERGDAPAHELAALVEVRFEVKVEAKLVPLFKAILREKELLAAARQKRETATSAPSG